MISAIRFSFLLLFVLIQLNTQAVYRKPVPANVGYINDFAKILSIDENAKLENYLKDYYDTTSTQIAVVIEQTLNGRDVFDRAMDFSRAWGVGTAGKNNGVVLYIAIDDRKIHILTTNETEDYISDGDLGEIIRNDITPYFKTKNYAGGIFSGIVKIQSLLNGTYTNDGKVASKNSLTTIIIIFVLFVLLSIFFRKNGNQGGGGYKRGGTYWFPSTGGGSWSGGSGGGGGWGGFGGGGGFSGGGAGGSW